MTHEYKIWIVDWDIPREPKSNRRMFYYYLKKFRKKYGLFGSMSTMSVMVVNDIQLAKTVHKIAKKYGQSHLYEARELKV